jgi:hypothetical protein
VSDQLKEGGRGSGIFRYEVLLCVIGEERLPIRGKKFHMGGEVAGASSVWKKSN